MELISVYIVAADAEEAGRIAEALVAERLAACVNQLGAVESTFRWEGKIDHACEVALIAKTRRSLFERLRTRVRTLHSYDVPAIVAWPIVEGDPVYLDWIVTETDDA